MGSGAWNCWWDLEPRKPWDQRSLQSGWWVEGRQAETWRQCRHFGAGAGGLLEGADRNAAGDICGWHTGAQDGPLTGWECRSLGLIMTTGRVNPPADGGFLSTSRVASAVLGAWPACSVCQSASWGGRSVPTTPRKWTQNDDFVCRGPVRSSGLEPEPPCSPARP